MRNEVLEGMKQETITKKNKNHKVERKSGWMVEFQAKSRMFIVTKIG